MSQYHKTPHAREWLKSPVFGLQDLTGVSGEKTISKGSMCRMIGAPRKRLRTSTRFPGHRGQSGGQNRLPQTHRPLPGVNDQIGR